MFTKNTLKTRDILAHPWGQDIWCSLEFNLRFICCLSHCSEMRCGMCFIYELKFWPMVSFLLLLRLKYFGRTGSINGSQWLGFLHLLVTSSNVICHIGLIEELIYIPAPLQCQENLKVLWHYVIASWLILRKRVLAMVVQIRRSYLEITGCNKDPLDCIFILCAIIGILLNPWTFYFFLNVTILSNIIPNKNDISI